MLGGVAGFVVGGMKDPINYEPLESDFLEYPTTEGQVDFIKKYDVIKSIKIFQSPSCNGYHLYIETTKELNWNEKIKYRKLFKDDGQRIVFDLLKKEELKDVLFSLRYNKGIITREIFIQFLNRTDVLH